MRMVLYLVILGLLFLAPLERADIAKLLPIEAVAVYVENGEVVLETDTQDRGRGTDVANALQVLKDTTPAVVYLDTAEFLLVSKDAVGYVEQLNNYLKPSVKVCICEASGRVKEAVKYLEVHGNLPKLRDWNEQNISMLKNKEKSEKTS